MYNSLVNRKVNYWTFALLQHACLVITALVYLPCHVPTGQLQKENDLLKNDLMAASHYKEENTTLDYVKQLVSMLQTSHTSIVNTNSQLLKELEEVKANHAKAIQQMHMNYEHLRKTVEVIHDS